MFSEAYSCGWKKARYDYPGKKAMWAEKGHEARKDRLALMQYHGVVVSKSYTL